jgi:hypothetical protein
VSRYRCHEIDNGTDQLSEIDGLVFGGMRYTFFDNKIVASKSGEQRVKVMSGISEKVNPKWLAYVSREGCVYCRECLQMIRIKKERQVMEFTLNI